MYLISSPAIARAARQIRHSDRHFDLRRRDNPTVYWLISWGPGIFLTSIAHTSGLVCGVGGGWWGVPESFPYFSSISQLILRGGHLPTFEMSCIITNMAVFALRSIPAHRPSGGDAFRASVVFRFGRFCLFPKFFALPSLIWPC